MLKDVDRIKKWYGLTLNTSNEVVFGMKNVKIELLITFL